MHQSVLNFAKRELRQELVENKDVLEVGSRNINGSVRPLVMAHNPASYVGIDMVDGPGVDITASAEELQDLLQCKAIEQPDLLICTEMLEHAESWREVIHQMKGVLKPEGYMIITTRGPGFPYHEYPGDYWRYTPDTMEAIFADFDIEFNAQDPECPGVFLIAKKPDDWKGTHDLSDIQLAKP